MSLRLHLLGTPGIDQDGVRLDISSNKAIALLAYLAANRLPQPRDRLLALLWPDSTTEAAHKNLRNVLWSLRRMLGDNAIIAQGSDLKLNAALQVDLYDLERVAEQPAGDSLTLLIAEFGVFLEGISLNDTPDFEAWLTGQRERIGQLYLRVVQNEINLLRTRQDWTNVILLAQKGLSFDDLQEPLHRILMEAYARLGQRGDALRQYDTLCQILSNELGVDPLPETQRVRNDILQGVYDRPNVNGAAVPAATRQPRRIPMLGDAPQVPFIGRETELAQLDSAFQRAVDGETRIALISGEMGIGKSRLWQEWSARLPQDATILAMRGLQATRSLPFAPLIELFNSNACLHRIASDPVHISGIWLSEIARVIPAMRAVLPDVPAPVTVPFDEERRRLFESFCQFMYALRAKPLVMFVDDTHWIDQALLDWLAYLVNSMHDTGLLLVIAYRQEELNTALAGIVAGWGRENLLHRIPLQRLSDREAAIIVKTLAGDVDFAPHLVAQSAGNPYFLIEMCRSGLRDVPRELSELVQTKLDRLSVSTRQTLQAASVLEPDFDFALLRRTSGRGEEETLDALDTLLDTSILVEKAGSYSFSHPLVATVVRSTLSSARKSFLHRRAAEAIETANRSRVSEVAALLLGHYAEAGERVKAAHYADVAAARAIELAAPVEAIAFYRQALLHESTPERQLSMGRALQSISDMDAAQVAFEDAYHTYASNGNRQGAARACFDLAGLNLGRGHIPQVQYWINESQKHVNMDADPESRALAHYIMAMGQLLRSGSLIEAETHLLETVAIASQHGLFELAGRGSFELGNLYARRGDLGSAMKAYFDALHSGIQAGDVMREILARNNIAYHSLLVGDRDQARLHIEAALALADATAIQMPRQYLYSTRGELSLADQEWDEAEEWFQRGKREAQKAGNAIQVANYIANLALVAQGRGDLDNALVLLQAAYADTAGLSAPFLLTQIDIWLAHLHLKRGEREAIEPILRRIESRPFVHEYHLLTAQATKIREHIYTP